MESSLVKQLGRVAALFLKENCAAALCLPHVVPHYILSPTLRFTNVCMKLCSGFPFSAPMFSLMQTRQVSLGLESADKHDLDEI